VRHTERSDSNHLIQNFFTKINLQTGIRFSNRNRDHDSDQKTFRKNQPAIFIPESIGDFRIKIRSRFSF